MTSNESPDDDDDDEVILLLKLFMTEICSLYGSGIVFFFLIFLEGKKLKCQKYHRFEKVVLMGIKSERLDNFVLFRKIFVGILFFSDENPKEKFQKRKWEHFLQTNT